MSNFKAALLVAKWAPACMTGVTSTLPMVPITPADLLDSCTEVNPYAGGVLCVQLIFVAGRMLITKLNLRGQFTFKWGNDDTEHTSR